MSAGRTRAATYLVPLGVVVSALVIAATDPPAYAPAVVAALEDWFDVQDGLGAPCEPSAPATRPGPAGVLLDVPACWILGTDGRLADPGLAVEATVERVTQGDARWEALAPPGETRGGHDGGTLLVTPFEAPPGEADPQVTIVRFLSGTAALRVRAATRNEFARSPKVAAHLERLEGVARSAR